MAKAFMPSNKPKEALIERMVELMVLHERWYDGA